MAIPKKVEEQAKKAEELQKEIIEAGKTADKKGQAPAGEEPKGKGKDVKKEEGKETPPVTTEPIPGEGTEDFKQKYTVLQGKYDTEVPQLQQQVRDAQQTIANLNVIVDSVQQRSEEPAKAKEEEKAKVELKDEDFEGYGSEMQELVTVLKDQATEIKAQTTEIKNLKGQVENVSQDVSQSNEDSFYSELTKLVPDWQTINKDLAWRKWLGEIDALTGQTRQALLDGAFSTLDHNRIATFFNTFKGDGEPKVTEPSKEISPDNGLAQIVDPPASTVPTGGPGSGKETPTVTAQDVTRASKDFQTGRITEEEFNKIANQFQQLVGKGTSA